MAGPADLQEALKKDQQNLGKRYIEGILNPLKHIPAFCVFYIMAILFNR